MLTLYKFSWVVSRMGTVRGLFVADSADVDVVIGKNVGFGDALGKHSDIHGTLERDDLTVLSTDPEFIEAATKCGVVPFGYNPLNYLYEEDDEEY